jgi:hypothetical protein
MTSTTAPTAASRRQDTPRPQPTTRRPSTIVTQDGTEIYPGAPHGLPDTHRDEINSDLLAFLKG